MIGGYRPPLQFAHRLLIIPSALVASQRIVDKITGIIIDTNLSLNSYRMVLMSK